jgi:UDP-glucose 4-epimerase
MIAGGAGYIGSHTVAELLGKVPDGEIVVADNLETGHKEAVLGGKLYVGDLRDDEFMERVFRENDIEEVIDFAAYSLVGESMTAPLKYYANNVGATLNLLKHMEKSGAKRIVFSSTAAVYGEPEQTPILESSPCVPTNSYGQTKLAVEGMLKWADVAHGIKYTSLRYFNAAGAHESGKIGEVHNPETHLIPLVLQTANGQREKLSIFGNDYPTPDGTCVRDYIHVTDLAAAHIAALKRMRERDESGVYNLGNGKGFSVDEVVNVCRDITGREIPTEICGRRQGDPAVLVASCEKATRDLGLEPRFGSLEKIVETAWNFHVNTQEVSV